MIRIGIVGAENSHAAAIATSINVQKKIPGARVVALWGETDEFATKTAEKGQIPVIVKRPRDMIGMIDGVMIDHRHAKHHLPAAETFLAARLPMFVDKPFCWRVAEGRNFLARARKAGVPVVSFSTVAMGRDFRRMKKKIAALGPLRRLVTSGPCDIKSKYGGVFFYAIHQVDAVIDLLGGDVATVQVNRYSGADHTVTMEYRNGPLVTSYLQAKDAGGWQFFAGSASGQFSYAPKGDADPYLAGAQTFVKMFRTGVEPIDHERFLAPIRVLEAMQKSVASGRREKVAR
ncbi:MAG: hypothetical protein BIFFINMI_03543 [Phycisphaerae bacterium]|nr:hypothetical protein [Phycisphaerae bacterium]